MMERITLSRDVAALENTHRTSVAQAADGPSFSERFRDALVSTNRSLQQAERSAQEMAEGKTDVVETVIALSHAELSLRHVVALRNRVFEAYQEIMRLQL
jgi:flagellar hook-basal body complex protein FliE